MLPLSARVNTILLSTVFFLIEEIAKSWILLFMVLQLLKELLIIFAMKYFMLYSKQPRKGLTFQNLLASNEISWNINLLSALYFEGLLLHRIFFK